MKGGFGFELLGFSFIFVTFQSPDCNSVTNDSAWVFESINTFEFFISPVLESKSLLVSYMYGDMMDEDIDYIEHAKTEIWQKNRQAGITGVDLLDSNWLEYTLTEGGKE